MPRTGDSRNRHVSRCQRKEVRLQKGLEGVTLLPSAVWNPMNFVSVVRGHNGRQSAALEQVEDFVATRIVYDPVKHVGVNAAFHGEPDSSSLVRITPCRSSATLATVSNQLVSTGPLAGCGGVLASDLGSLSHKCVE
jgi:hypothetical protein